MTVDACYDDTCHTEPLFANRGGLVRMRSSVHSQNAGDVMEKFLERFANSRVSDEHDVVVSSC